MGFYKKDDLEERIKFPWDCDYNESISYNVKENGEWVDKKCAISELRFGVIITLSELPKLKKGNYGTLRNNFGYALSPYFEKYRKPLDINIERVKIGNKTGIVLDENLIKCIQYSKQIVRNYHRDYMESRGRKKKKKDKNLLKKKVNVSKFKPKSLEEVLKVSKEISFTRIFKYLLKKYPFTMKDIYKLHLGGKSVVIFLKNLNLEINKEFRVGIRDAYLTFGGVKKLIQYVEDLDKDKEDFYDDFEDDIEGRKIVKTPSWLENIVNKKSTS